MNKHNIYLLLPLFVINMIFQGEIFYGLIVKSILNKKFKKYEIDAEKIFFSIKSIWDSLTLYRKEEIVNIETEEVYVKIKFI
ncbi:MAG: hypothetical protein ACLFPS_03940 [Clostridia bacterium]